VRVVDLFAGFGGLTTGAELAGARVVYAANHWPLAVAVHAQNHPHVAHVCQDLRQADWTKLPPYDLLTAAPSCQPHSMASQPQRRPYHDEMRATAWAVVDCADATEPRALVVENVLAFRRWRLYPIWRAALEALGYGLTELEITASNYGVPQRRTRLFIFGTRTGRAVQLPPPRREPAFETCLEATASGWRPIASVQPKARRRIAAAQARSGRRCLVQHVTGHPGVPLHEPIRTITTKDQWILVDGDVCRPLTLREVARGMGFADSYILPEVSRANAIRGFGNAVCPGVGKAAVRAAMEAA